MRTIMQTHDRHSGLDRPLIQSAVPHPHARDVRDDVPGAFGKDANPGRHSERVIHDSLFPVDLRIERVAQAVTQQVEGQHREEDRQHRE